jgi:hypothetical protein
MSLHTVAIVLHALSAMAAFFVGVVLLLPTNTLRQLQLARVVLALLLSMAAFLVIAIFSHLTILPTIKQLIFGALFLLLLYMIWRSVQAVTVLSEPKMVDQRKVVDHVGFVLISLFDGFAIVSALDLQAPGWLIAAVAVGAVAIGIAAITLRKESLTIQQG